MRKGKLVAASALVIGAMPIIGHAATVTFTYDLADFTYSTDQGNTFQPATVTGTAANPVVSVPVGSILEIGLDGDVTNNPNPASGTGYDATHHNQPTSLGLVQFQVGLSDSNATVASVFDGGTGQSTAAVNANFTSLTAPGNLNGSGGINSSAGIDGTNIIAGNDERTSSPGNVAKLSYGANAAAELFNSLAINDNALGTATFALTDNDTALQYAVNATTGGSVAGPTYTNRTFVAATDTLSTLPTLTVNVVAVPEPASMGLLAMGTLGLLRRRRHTGPAVQGHPIV